MKTEERQFSGPVVEKPLNDAETDKFNLMMGSNLTSVTVHDNHCPDTGRSLPAVLESSREVGNLLHIS